ncbi:uncharacterized protein ACNS7B_021121 [Menidia menidia]
MIPQTNKGLQSTTRVGGLAGECSRMIPQKKKGLQRGHRDAGDRGGGVGGRLATDIDSGVLDMRDFRLLYTVFHVVAMCSTFANPLLYGWIKAFSKTQNRAGVGGLALKCWRMIPQRRRASKNSKSLKTSRRMIPQTNKGLQSTTRAVGLAGECWRTIPQKKKGLQRGHRDAGDRGGGVGGRLATDIDSGVLDMRDFRLLYTVFHVVAMCSTFANPLLYGWMNRNYRAAFLAVFKCGRANGQGGRRMDSVHPLGGRERERAKKIVMETHDTVSAHLNATDV